jgi:hypothetical protein
MEQLEAEKIRDAEIKRLQEMKKEEYREKVR